MYKKLILCALACGMLAGCNKETPEIAGQAGNDEHQGLVKMELRCNIEPLNKVETKAGAADDKVYRLDILEYDGDYTLVDHHTYTNATGLDLANFLFEQWLPYGNTRYYFLLGNLHEDSVNYIKSKPTNWMQSSAIPLEAGNWSDGHIPMGGWTYCYFNGSSPTATLYRYMFRIDIGTITADFGEDLMAKNVRVKSVSIINGNQFFCPVNSNYSKNQSFRSCPLGYDGSISSYNPFGGLTTGYSSINMGVGTSTYEDTVWDMSGEAFGGTGLLAAEFYPLYNYNKLKAKHVLNITAPASIRDMCYYSVPSGSGTLAPSGTHVYSLGRSLYGVPRYVSSYGSTYSGATCLENYEYQYDYMKLVIEVEVDGVNYFYPILLRMMQPNTLYSIQNITLKGPGSEYSNFFERQYYGNVSAPAVLEWTDCTISNIDVGYTDDTGTAIY